MDNTNNTSKLVDQITGDNNLIVTTIQKLNNAISNRKYSEEMNQIKDKRIVFIFDECHRSQFGDTHKRITNFRITSYNVCYTKLLRFILYLNYN